MLVNRHFLAAFMVLLFSVCMGVEVFGSDLVKLTAQYGLANAFDAWGTETCLSHGACREVNVLIPAGHPWRVAAASTVAVVSGSLALERRLTGRGLKVAKGLRYAFLASRVYAGIHNFRLKPA